MACRDEEAKQDGRRSPWTDATTRATVQRFGEDYTVSGLSSPFANSGKPPSRALR